jgi:hypothetical protein
LLRYRWRHRRDEGVDHEGTAARLGYLDLAYRFGRDFATDRDAAEAALA